MRRAVPFVMVTTFSSLATPMTTCVASSSRAASDFGGGGVRARQHIDPTTTTPSVTLKMLCFILALLAERVAFRRAVKRRLERLVRHLFLLSMNGIH